MTAETGHVMSTDTRSVDERNADVPRNYDVVVVGGGPAGLSAALTLSRARRSVLVVDAGEPRNARASGVHNYLGREGTPPAELLALGRAEVAGYGGEVVTGTVTVVERLDGDAADGRPRFGVTLADGRAVRARRLLVATGLVDELPDVPGLAERWGRDVLHCPYCHGWEVRDQPVGVLATSEFAVHQALMWRQWTRDVILFRHTGPALTEQQAEQLAARGVAVVDGEVAGLEVTDDRLTGVRLRSGEVIARRAVVVASRPATGPEPFASLAALGLRPTEARMGDLVLGERVEAGPTGATSVAGVWVAGNVAEVRAQVASSVASGVMTAAALNADLIAEDTELAVEAHRYERLFSEQAWSERHRAHAAEHADSDDPNPVLVAAAADLPPGTVLDAGAGTGADACWLAGQGWKVTAVDLSKSALERAEGRATRLGHDITWVHADLAAQPAPGSYDLVTAHYLCLPPAQRRPLFAHLAAAVAPGGTLLLVGHALVPNAPSPNPYPPAHGDSDSDSDSDDGHGHGHASHGHAGHGDGDRHSGASEPRLAEVAWDAADVAASLGPGWTVESAETRPRAGAPGHHGAPHDSILRARRT